MKTPMAYFEFAGPSSADLAAFYRSVLAWDTAPGPFPGYLSVPETESGVAGGFRQEATPECLVYFRVENLAETCGRVEAAGGTVVVPPTNVPGVVHFALVTDTAGNRLGLVQ